MNRNSKDVTNINPTFKFTLPTNENKQMGSLLPRIRFTENKKIHLKQMIYFLFKFRLEIKEKVEHFLKRSFFCKRKAFLCLTKDLKASRVKEISGKKKVHTITRQWRQQETTWQVFVFLCSCVCMYTLL